jgi:hypothetical protein
MTTVTSTAPTPAPDLLPPDQHPDVLAAWQAREAAQREREDAGRALQQGVAALLCRGTRRRAPAALVSPRPPVEELWDLEAAPRSAPMRLELLGRRMRTNAGYLRELEEIAK